MEGSDDNEFPGFQILVPKEKDEYLKIKRSLSRLQRRAPRPLQLKPAATVASSMQCSGAAKSTAYTANSSAFPSSSFASCYHSKDPIPLLSPLVLPSFSPSKEHGHHVQGENTATSSSFS